MGMLFSMKSGSWSLYSKTDTRWNSSGSAEYCGGFTMPAECKVELERLKKKLGTPPDDLEYSYMKD